MKSFLLLVILFSLASCGFEIVDTGNRGVKTVFGKVEGKPLGEGLHFYNPFSADIYEYTVRESVYKDKTIVFTKDTQQTEISIAAVFYPDPQKVGDIYSSIGKEKDLEDKIIHPIILGVLKDTIGKVDASELVSKREQITKDSMTSIQAELKTKGVILTGLQFTNIDFNDSYEKAIEEKATATQLALKAKNETVQIEEESKQQVIKAKAEAESMRIRSQALSQNKSLVDYEAVQKWNGVLPVTVLSGSIPFINIKN